MFKVALASVVAALGAAACIVPAAAAVRVTTEAFNAGYDPSAPDLIDFDHPLPSGFVLSGGLVRTADDGLGALPAIAPGVKGSTAYLSVNPGEYATITSNTGYSSVSFLWGSVDSYNTLYLLGAGGTTIAIYSGSDIAIPATGDQLSELTNRRVTFTTENGASIYGIALESSQPAFEIDDVSFSGAVPEPATWGMMVLGFGVMGFAMRRQKATAKVSYAA